MEITGVGDCTVILGAVNIKVVIVDFNNRAESEELMKEVTKNIGENRQVLPGTLMLVSAAKLAINISVKVKYDIKSIPKSK